MLIPVLLMLALVTAQGAPHVPPPPEPQETAAAAVDELVETAREGDNATAADAQAALALLLRLTDRGAA